MFQNEAVIRAYGPRKGEKCYAAYRKRPEPCENCIILDVIRTGEPRNALRDVHLPDGDVLWMEVFSGPYRDEQGAIIGAVEIVRDVTERIRLNETCVTLRREMERQAQFHNIVTQSRRMKTVFRTVERVASTMSSVLITGESGTGKELIARALVFNSDRRDKSFVTVNCGAIPENLIESELFGHVRGAFTGAVRDHKGLIEEADGGTLFLDEIGDIPRRSRSSFSVSSRKARSGGSATPARGNSMSGSSPRRTGTSRRRCATACSERISSSASM